jgi:hypothetical protein
VAHDSFVALIALSAAPYNGILSSACFYGAVSQLVWGQTVANIVSLNSNLSSKRKKRQQEAQ